MEMNIIIISKSFNKFLMDGLFSWKFSFSVFVFPFSLSFNSLRDEQNTKKKITEQCIMQNGGIPKTGTTERFFIMCIHVITKTPCGIK